MLIRRLLPLISLAALAACGDDGPPSGPGNLSGSMTFTYTGGGGGTFTASGIAPTTSANLGSTNWSAGFRDDAANQISVFGVRTRSGGRYDLMILGISRLTVGSVSVEADCDPDLGENCSGFIYFVNISDADENMDFMCFPTSGSMAITSISGSRAQGTFTGSGNCVHGTTGAVSSFVVTNGSFDVALLSESQLP